MMCPMKSTVLRRQKEGNLLDLQCLSSNSPAYFKDRDVRTFQNLLEAENVILKTRKFADIFYPWAA